MHIRDYKLGKINKGIIKKKTNSYWLNFRKIIKKKNSLNSRWSMENRGYNDCFLALQIDFRNYK